MRDEGRGGTKERGETIQSAAGVESVQRISAAVGADIVVEGAFFLLFFYVEGASVSVE